jgi:hypothetical protein
MNSPNTAKRRKASELVTPAVFIEVLCSSTISPVQVDEANSFIDYAGTSMRSIELGLRHATAKSKPLPIIGNQELVLSFVAFTQCNDDMARPAVFPYIREPFLDDAHNLVAYTRWQRDVLLPGFKADRNTGITPKSRH